VADHIIASYHIMDLKNKLFFPLGLGGRQVPWLSLLEAYISLFPSIRLMLTTAYKPRQFAEAGKESTSNNLGNVNLGYRWTSDVARPRGHRVRLPPRLEN